jgi:GDP-L-fucose synthase
MRTFWQGKRVLVTGGAGFIGSRIVQGLLQRGVSGDDILTPRSAACDLRLAGSCRNAVEGRDIVIHLAAPTGGIAFSRTHPASQYRDCTLINLNMLNAAREAGVAKFVALGNLLAYPAAAQSPLREDALHQGPIADTHLGIGLAKRDMVSLARMYHAEYAMDVVNVLSANAYGPGDRFEGPESHVIPATIVKSFRDEDLVVWGDGSPTRDFLFVDDIAEGILLAAERLEGPGFVNLASGNEISIADLVRLIAGKCGFRRRIVFDVSKGSGDPRRVASTELASSLIGFTPTVSLADGLDRTIRWYRERSCGSALQ